MATDPAGTTPPGDTQPVDVFTLTSEQATKQLAEMKSAFDGPPPTDKPSTPREARARLQELSHNVDWQQRYANGDLAARDEFNALTTTVDGDKDPVSGLLRGDPAPNEMRIGPGYATLKEMASIIPGLRDEGITDGQIHQLMTDHVFTPEEVAAVQRLQIKLHSTPEWTQRLLAGDAEAKREQLLMSMVLLQKAT
jgi:hypothetical protein